MLLLRLCFEPILFLPRPVELRELGTLRPLLLRATMGIKNPVPVLGLPTLAAASDSMAVDSICSRTGIKPS
jgi:hypothetical protein